MKHLTAAQISIRNHFDVTQNSSCPNRQNNIRNMKPSNTAYIYADGKDKANELTTMRMTKTTTTATATRSTIMTTTLKL